MHLSIGCGNKGSFDIDEVAQLKVFSLTMNLSGPWHNCPQMQLLSGKLYTMFAPKAWLWLCQARSHIHLNGFHHNTFYKIVACSHNKSAPRYPIQLCGTNEQPKLMKNTQGPQIICHPPPYAYHIIFSHQQDDPTMFEVGPKFPLVSCIRIALYVRLVDRMHSTPNYMGVIFGGHIKITIQNNVGFFIFILLNGMVEDKNS